MEITGSAAILNLARMRASGYSRTFHLFNIARGSGGVGIVMACRDPMNFIYLEGPSGIGKTTTMGLLGKKYPDHVNPIENDFAEHLIRNPGYRIKDRHTGLGLAYMNLASRTPYRMSDPFMVNLVDRHPISNMMFWALTAFLDYDGVLPQPIRADDDLYYYQVKGQYRRILEDSFGRVLSDLYCPPEEKVIVLMPVGQAAVSILADRVLDRTVDVDMVSTPVIDTMPGSDLKERAVTYVYLQCLMYDALIEVMPGLDVIELTKMDLEMDRINDKLTKAIAQYCPSFKSVAFEKM